MQKYLLKFELLEALHLIQKNAHELRENKSRLVFKWARDIPNEGENGNVLIRIFFGGPNFRSSTRRKIWVRMRKPITVALMRKTSECILCEEKM